MGDKNLYGPTWAEGKLNEFKDNINVPYKTEGQLKADKQKAKATENAKQAEKKAQERQEQLNNEVNSIFSQLVKDKENEANSKIKNGKIDTISELNVYSEWFNNNFHAWAENIKVQVKGFTEDQIIAALKNKGQSILNAAKERIAHNKAKVQNNQEDEYNPYEDMLTDAGVRRAASEGKGVRTASSKGGPNNHLTAEQKATLGDNLGNEAAKEPFSDDNLNTPPKIAKLVKDRYNMVNDN